MTIASAEAPSKSVAFFDVDGTLVKTTIVDYYIYFRRKRMTPIVGRLWEGAYLIKCVYYLILDKINRSRLNRTFYRDYRGLPSAEIKAQVPDCFRDLIEPRRFGEGDRCVQAHREAGRDVVLVTGSIDFIVEPLARWLGAADVVAPSLLESNGRFTGELNGPPIGDEEKAKRVRAFAAARRIDLSRSHAYGDSIADLPMLEAVGFPHAVNPDRALAAVAKARGWPTHHWRIAESKGNNGP